MTIEGRTVLVAEDEFYLAKEVVAALKASGARIMGPFPRKQAALAAINVETPHCAVIDINLGAGADFELADALGSRGVPFLFFTGYDAEVIPDRFAAVQRLEKPVDSARLIEALAAVCGASVKAIKRD